MGIVETTKAGLEIAAGLVLLAKLAALPNLFLLGALKGLQALERYVRPQ